MILRDDSRIPISISDMGRVLQRFDITLTEWVRILSCYTTEARVRLALRFLMVERKLAELLVTHEDLCELTCTSREKVTRAVVSLRRKGVIGSAGGRGRRGVIALGSVAP
jgi:CRP-like cAMP-binding protein